MATQKKKNNCSFISYFQLMGNHLMIINIVSKTIVTTNAARTFKRLGMMYHFAIPPAAYLNRRPHMAQLEMFPAMVTGATIPGCTYLNGRLFSESATQSNNTLEVSNRWNAGRITFYVPPNLWG